VNWAEIGIKTVDGFMDNLSQQQEMIGKLSWPVIDLP
jgi:hypothetical protein